MSSLCELRNKAGQVSTCVHESTGLTSARDPTGGPQGWQSGGGCTMWLGSGHTPLQGHREVSTSTRVHVYPMVLAISLVTNADHWPLSLYECQATHHCRLGHIASSNLLFSNNMNSDRDGSGDIPILVTVFVASREVAFVQ